MRRTPALVAAIVLCSSLPLDEAAPAANCAPLEMRLMQLQGRGAAGSSEAREIRGMLEACQGNAPTTGFSWWHNPPPREQVSSTIRTLCVRSCDGYYFPISFATTRDRLEADEAACQRMCPNGDASLFYHASRGQISDQAISISGAPYTALENAFRYRSVLDRSCTCGRAVPDPQEEAMLRAFPSLPAPRVDPGEDPETLLNRQGGLTYPSPVPTYALLRDPPAPRSVRVIFAEGSAEQDQLMLSEVPNARFRPEEGPFVYRGPGEIMCVDRRPACATR